MTFEEMVPLWRSPHNSPSPVDMERHKASIASHLAKEYREFLWHVGMATALTLFMAGGFVQYLRSGGAFDFGSEWASVLFLLLPFGVAVLFLRGFIKHRQQHPRYDFSMLAALRASIDQNRLARLRLRVSIFALTLAMAGVPLMTNQLMLVGKQRPHEAASMVLVFGIVYVIAVGVQIWMYRCRLLPEKSRLEELLRSYED